MSTVDIEEAERVETMLSGPRWEHTRRVVELVEEIADQYNLPSEPLMRAALLHDVGKGLDWGEQQRRARLYRGELDPVEQQLPELWHGPAGAHYCQTELHPRPPKQILFAVAEHSTGHPEADYILLALLVADFCEPGRPWEQAHTLRERIGSLELEALAREALKYKLIGCLNRNQIVHLRTVEAFNKLCDPAA